MESFTLPVEWSVHLSKSQNKEYYFNKKTNQRFWIEPSLPKGWVSLVRKDGTKVYFLLGAQQQTETTTKPELSSHNGERDEVLTGSNAHVSNRSSNEPERTQISPARPNLQRVSSSSSSTAGSSNYSLSRILTPASANDQNKNNSDSSPAVLNSEKGENDPNETEVVEVTIQQVGHVSEAGNPSAGSAHRTSTSTAKVEEVEHREKRRKFNEVDQQQPSRPDSHVAASFYDRLKRQSQKDRGGSLLFHLRALNNWIKASLMSKYAKDNARILDLGCGKGGDLGKWAHQNIHSYVGLDIAHVSLEDAVSRVEKMKRLGRVDIRFAQADLGEISLDSENLSCWNRQRGWYDGRLIRRDETFDIASMQFAFHYMFGSRDRCHRFFRNLSHHLESGASFLITTVDANVLIQKLFQNNFKTIQFLDNVDRETCRIAFDDESTRRIINSSIGRHREQSTSSATQELFGLRYTFTLRDSEEEQGGEAVDAPEYLIPEPLLRDMAEQYGFDIVRQQNFQSFVHDVSRNHAARKLMERMHVLDYKGSLSNIEWSIAQLYQIIVLRKK